MYVIGMSEGIFENDIRIKSNRKNTAKKQFFCVLEGGGGGGGSKVQLINFGSSQGG